MSNQDTGLTPDEIAAYFIAITDASERHGFLLQQRDSLDVSVIEALKARADAELLRDASWALHIAEVSAEAAAFLTDPLAEPLVLWAQANALLYLGRYRECLDNYERARTVYARHGKKLEAARLRVNEITPLQHLGRYDDALRAADEARELLSGFEATRYAAILEMNVGNMCYLPWRLSRGAGCLRARSGAFHDAERSGSGCTNGREPCQGAGKPRPVYRGRAIA